MRTRLFIGISKNRKSYVLTSRNDETKQIKTFQSTVPSFESIHGILLYALIKYLEIANPKEEIIFYSCDNIISFEWEMEIKKEHDLSKKTKERTSQWEKIEKLVNDKKIKLSIVGDDSPLSVLGKLSIN